MGGEVQSAWTSGSYGVGEGGFLFYFIFLFLFSGVVCQMYFINTVTKDTLMHIGFHVRWL